MGFIIIVVHAWNLVMKSVRCLTPLIFMGFLAGESEHLIWMLASFNINLGMDFSEVLINMEPNHGGFADHFLF